MMLQLPRTILSILLLSVCACLSHASETGKEAMVFLLAGQSNMLGWGQKPELPAELSELPENVELHAYAVGTRSLNDSKRFGPEVSFAHAIAKEFPDEHIIIIKDATGGTSLYAWAPDYDPAEAAKTKNNRGPLYSLFWDNIRRHTEGRAVHFVGLVWMQGERDSKFEFAAKAYAENFATLIAAFREDTGEPELPVVFGHVNAPAAKFPFVATVREQQAKAAEKISGLTLVDTEGLSKKADEVHYNTAGQLELGKRFAQAILATQ